MAPHQHPEVDDNFKDELISRYVGESLLLPRGFDPDWLEYWFHTFLALPSFMKRNSSPPESPGSDCSLVTPTLRFQEELFTLLQTHLPPDAISGIEKWVVHDLVKVVYGADIETPTSQFEVNGSTTFFYKYDQLRHWLPLQAYNWYKRLKTLEVEEIFARYHESCCHYISAHRTFLRLHSTLLKIINRGSDGCGTRYNLPDIGVLWRWLLLFQIIGEHIGHVLREFPGTILHHLGHPPNGHSYDHEIHLREIAEHLSTDWGTNDGLTELLFRYVDRCTTEVPYIASWAKGLLSTLQLQLEIAIDPRISPDCDSRHQNKPKIHSSCSIGRYERASIPESAYEQTHMPHCECDLGRENPRPDIKAVKAAISRRKIPLITVERGIDSQIHLGVVEYEKGTPFVAISHVWSDGRGSRRGRNENSLPACQLEYLYETCIRETGCPIWMDTLCIPHDEVYRPKAIALMNEIYLNAAEVRVISNDLLNIHYHHHIDSWLSLQTSEWMRRCWTLQEGVFGGQKMVFCFDNDAVGLGDFLLWPPYLLESPVYTFMIHLPRAFSEIRYWTEKKQTGRIIERILREFQWRETSYVEDTAAIFGGLLGLDVERIAGVSWRQDDCMQERLNMLFQKLDAFPASILYSRVPRMDTPGRKWAPQTLQIPDWVDDPGHGAGFGFLSAVDGHIVKSGFSVWTHLVFIELESKRPRMPKAFRLELNKGKDGPNVVPFVLLEVSQLDFIQKDRTNVVVRESDDGFEAFAEQPQFQHFAVVLRAFDRKAASKGNFGTDAAIVSLSPGQGIQDFKADWENSSKLNLFKWIADRWRWKIPLSGSYVCPARVKSVLPGKQRPRPKAMSSRALGKRPSRDPYPEYAPDSDGDDDHAHGGNAFHDAPQLTEAEGSSRGIEGQNSSIHSDLESTPLLRSGPMKSSQFRRRRPLPSASVFAAQATEGYEMRQTGSAGDAPADEDSVPDVEDSELECFEGHYPGDWYRIVIG